MANIRLTDRFKIILEKDQEIDGIVKSTLAKFGDILKKNDLYFFKGYTDHGIEHIEKVIASSENLITNSTFDNLSPCDIGYYLLAVILHDLGMHIGLEGFKCLIEGEYDSIRIKELDPLSWRDLWEDYLKEAKKFNGKQLKSIFGNENTIIKIPNLSLPNSITEEDKMLIGEFIRRHHPRLAHEIASKGYPGSPQILPFAENLSDKIRSMIGLIARSHGMDLRKCVDYIEQKYGKHIRVVPNNTHASFLMILLRIADYIQIDKSRTSQTLLKIKTFSSPVSQLEHQAHLSIDSIDDKYQNDPERIFVYASPEDSVMYLKILNLIKDIQHEFDLSWAVLGELYGTKSDKPQIKFRRIISNLEDSGYIINKNYIADYFSFKANDEISKLLIGPLYGDDITYGVRELLQNSIDACKEREEIEKNRVKEFSPKITVEIIKDDNKDLFFLIKDNGIGMDVDVIKNYFLSAGSSYRKSLEWLKQFVDVDGKANVRRNGRFGVGILAAFLIGDEIEVETQKLGSDFGLKFSANLNIDQINIVKFNKEQSGTTIKIKINNDTLNLLNPKLKRDYDKIKWHEWYVFSSPEIIYIYLGEELNKNRKFDPDLADNNLPNDWNLIDSKGFDKILWTYSKKYSSSKFTCNGIVIPLGYSRHVGFENNEISLVYPKVSVFDNNGFLPLSLSRNGLTRKVSFDTDLLEDLYRDIIACFLCTDNLTMISDSKIQLKSIEITHPSLTTSYGHNNFGINSYSKVTSNIKQILFSKKGFILNYNYFISRVNETNSVFIQLNEKIKQNELNIDIRDNFIMFSNLAINSIYDYRFALEPQNYNSFTNSYEIPDVIFYLKTTQFDYLFDKYTKRITKWLRETLKIDSRETTWTTLRMNNYMKSVVTKEFLSTYGEKLNFIREYKLMCLHSGDSTLNMLLEKYLGDDVIIPYSIEERKRKYPLAFKELERYMIKYI